MIREGRTAPDVSLPGVEGGEPAVYDLHRAVEGGDAVLLWFAPATFLPTATAELVTMGDAGWHGDGLQVWAVTADSIYAAAAYRIVHLADGAGTVDVYRDDEKYDTEEVSPPIPAKDAFDHAEEDLRENTERFVERFERWHGVTDGSDP